MRINFAITADLRLFIIFFLRWHLGLGGKMWWLFGQNIDFEANQSFQAATIEEEIF